MERRDGEAPRTVEEIVNTPVRFGDGGTLPPLFHVVDYRGHRQREIADYAAGRRNVIMYAGAFLKGETWKPSSKNPRMIIVDAKSFQRRLIWYLYNQKNRTTDYLWLPDTFDRKYQAEISGVQPDKTRRSGHLPENWQPLGDAVHDAFDVLKMAYFAVDFAIKRFNRSRFRVGKSPALLRRWRAYDERHGNTQNAQK